MDKVTPAIREAFNKYDRDGSGDIDAAELRDALEAVGLVVDEGQCGCARARGLSVGGALAPLRTRTANRAFT